MQAEAKSNSESYLSEMAKLIPSVVPASLQDLSDYLPEKIKSYIPQGSNVPFVAKDSVLWTFFYCDSSTKSELLLLGLTSGFQVWDLQSMKEILSKRMAPIKQIQTFYAKTPPLTKSQTPEPDQSAILSKTKLFYAMISAEDSGDFTRNQLRLCDYASGDFVHTLRFQSDIYNFIAAHRTILVGLYNEILAFDQSLRNIFKFSCYPRLPQNLPESNHVLLDMTGSTAWIAYQSNAEVPKQASVQPTSKSDALIEVAKEVANGVLYIGDMGAKKVSEYISLPIQSNETPTDNVAGNVMIRNISDGKIISHFRPHSKPVACLQFDPTGLKIFTSSISGRHINVFQVNPFEVDITKSATHIYRFTRGVTTATIQNIEVSADCKWASVTSNRGTTHIFAVDEDGRIPSTETHLRRNTGDPKVGHYRNKRHSSSQQQWPISSSSHNRIKVGLNYHGSAAQMNQKAQLIRCRMSAYFSCRDEPAMYLISNDALLYKYILNPHGADKIEENPTSLYLDVEKVAEWDVSRKMSWPEVTLKSEQRRSTENASLRELNRFSSRIETKTSNYINYQSFWVDEQFNMSVYQTERPFNWFTRYEALESSVMTIALVEAKPASQSDLSTILIDVPSGVIQFQASIANATLAEIYGSTQLSERAREIWEELDSVHHENKVAEQAGPVFDEQRSKSASSTARGLDVLIQSEYQPVEAQNVNMSHDFTSQN